MKRRLPSFFAGMLTMLLLCSLTMSALAISGRMTLEVEPINVMVNGEVFQPKDGLGRDVPVFVYRGTTYAPLRALAEAYGLDVGYDAKANIATVSKHMPSDSYLHYDLDIAGSCITKALAKINLGLDQNSNYSMEDAIQESRIRLLSATMSFRNLADDAETLGFHDIAREANYQYSCAYILVCTGRSMTNNEYALAVINYSAQFTKSYVDILTMLTEHGVTMPSGIPSDWTAD